MDIEVRSVIENKKVKKEIVVIILLLLISIPAVKSFFILGAYTSHDLTHHIIRQISMNRLLSEGQFPPRWSGELNNGYGYPVFLFNYPLPALLGEVFHKMGLGFVDSVKAVLFTSMIISILGMYLFLKELFGSRLSAFLGPCFYLYAPIRFLNVYVSAAVGSALALGILPFVFWSLVLISKGDKGNRANWGILIGALSFAGLILAHNVTALIFAPVILGFSAILGWRIRDIRVIREIAGMIILGLGLSAWFWVPALFEAQYTRFDQIFGGFYKDQFPSLWQLIRSPWGYGLSHPQNPERGDISYQLGLIHILVMLILGVSLWFFRGIWEIRVIGGFVLIAFALSVFFMLEVSLPIWENLPFLSLIQFPLRFSAVAVFSASIGAGLLAKYLPFKKFLVLSLLLLVIYANRNHWNINEVFNPGEEYYLNLKTTSTTYGEHLPKWGRVINEPSPAKVEIIRGVGEIRVINDKSDKLEAEVEAKTSTKLRFNQFYFPGWEIEIDGKKVQFDYLSDTQSYGLPIFDISSGIHKVEVEFRNTPVRDLADGISVIIFITVITIILKKCRLLPPN